MDLLGEIKEDESNEHNDEEQQEKDDTEEYINYLTEGQKKRFLYILKKTELYSHFMSKVVQLDDNENKESDSSPSNNKSYQFIESPTFIKQTQMRSYQVTGLNWLISLHDNGINGILADEMGLGKTIQSIALLGYLKYHTKIKNQRHLIVVPLATINNWVSEINIWCPGFRLVQLPHNDYIVKDDRIRYVKSSIEPGKWDICIVSYEMLFLEFSSISKFIYKYIIIDEAHKIKNSNTRISKIVRKLKVSNRLLLTGTPLQNNIRELWALLNFLMPDIFTNVDDFDLWFSNDYSKITSKQSQQSANYDGLVKRLQNIIQPFLLRRLKSVVCTELKPKLETKIYVNLSKMQYDLYKKILHRDLEYVDGSGFKRKMSLAGITQKLRQCANHPYFIDGMEQPPFTMNELVLNSGKMIILDKLLEKLKVQNSRVLIFTQFLHMLDVLEDYFIWKKYNYCRIEGKIKSNERDAIIKKFNEKNGDIFAFILTTRTGGLGINLTTADTVIIYDSDWNPQADLQAIDRCHRIGQMKQVYVYRLITEHTIEEHIQNCADIKLLIDRLIIQQGKYTKRRQQDDNNMNSKQAIYRFCIEQFGNIKIGNSDNIDEILQSAHLKTIEYNKKLTKLVEDKKEMAIEYLWNLNDQEDDDYNNNNNNSSNDNNVKLNSLRKFNILKVYSADQVYDFQFLPDRAYELHNKQLLIGHLTAEESDEFKELSQSGFYHWSPEIYNRFLSGLNKYGRDNSSAIADFMGLSVDEVKRYLLAFFKNWLKLSNYTELKSTLLKTEKKLNRIQQLEDEIKLKISIFKNPMTDMKLVYKQELPNSHKLLSQFDKFILVTMYNMNKDYRFFVQLLLKLREKYIFNTYIQRLHHTFLENHYNLLLEVIDIEPNDTVNTMKRKLAMDVSNKENEENILSNRLDEKWQPSVRLRRLNNDDAGQQSQVLFVKQDAD